jgi:hypothetical protein
VIDYRGIFFKKEYSDLGMIVLPMGVFRVFITVVLFPLSMWLMILPIAKYIQKVNTVGFNFSFGWNFDWFFVHFTQIQLFAILGLLMSFFTIWMGREIVSDKRKYTIDIIYMLIMYTFIAPIWLIKSSWNALRSKKSSWR